MTGPLVGPGPLVANDLWRRHRTASGPVTALAEVDLTVPPGHRIGVVGASGSGKTTLVRLLLGLDRPDRGGVRMGDRPVRPGSVRRLRWYRRLVQYVPQDPAGTLDPRRTVRRAVGEPLIRLAVPGDHDELVQSAVTAVGLDPGLLDRRPGQLSGGQCQRIAIARAAVARPAVLLADEPVSGLDPATRDLVLSVLHDLSVTAGTALLMVSHDLSAVARWCDRVVVLDRGRVVEDGPAGRVLGNPASPAARALVAAGSVPPVPSSAVP